MRGVNWIPDDCFPTRVDPRRATERHRARPPTANINLLRVWGGGIYESEDFYDVCDELGLLVWQDFLFACAAYPEEEPLRGEVEAEARENVTRLAAAPDPGAVERQQREHLGLRRLGLAGAARRAAPGARATTSTCCPRSSPSSTRPARTRPGSPWSGSLERHPNDPAHGTMHIWDVWNQRRLHRLPRATSRGSSPSSATRRPPTWSTLRRALHDEPLRPDSPGMLHHQKADDGNAKLDARPRARTCRVPERLRRLALRSPSCNQARAVAVRRRALPVARAALHGHDRLAAQRLLAGHVLGGHRRRRAAQAALVRAARTPTPTGC